MRVGAESGRCTGTFLVLSQSQHWDVELRASDGENHILCLTTAFSLWGSLGGAARLTNAVWWENSQEGSFKLLTHNSCFSSSSKQQIWVTKQLSLPTGGRWSLKKAKLVREGPRKTKAERAFFLSLTRTENIFGVFYVLMIRSVEMYDTPNAMVPFAGGNTKKKMWRHKFRSSLAFFAVKFLGFRAHLGKERGIGSSSHWFRAKTFLSSHSELGRRGTQVTQSSTCRINSGKSLLCRSFIQPSEVSFWPSAHSWEDDVRQDTR